jgi:3-oxoacyl-[acyl-carrier-protein] synthase II
LSSEPDIVVTGLGLSTCLGTTQHVWERGARGQTGIAPLEAFAAPGYPCQSAAIALDPFARELRVPKNVKFMSRATRLLMSAALDAAADVRLAEIPGERIGIYTASGQLGPEPGEFFAAFRMAQDAEGRTDWSRMGGPAARLIDPSFPLRTLSNAGAALLAIELGARGPGASFVQSEIAGVEALSAACRDLRAGRCDIAITGACDALVNETNYLAHHSAGLLGSAQRPFDKQADGLVLGEGAAVLILERRGDRNLESLAVIDRMSTSTNTFPSRAPFSSQEAVSHCIGQALDGRVPALVIATGIGLAEADRIEASLLGHLFGQSAVLTAFKGLTGYLGAATALVETALAILMLRHRTVWPLAPLHDPISALAKCRVADRLLPMPETTNALALCLCHSWGGQAGAVTLQAA